MDKNVAKLHIFATFLPKFVDFAKFFVKCVGVTNSSETVDFQYFEEYRYFAEHRIAVR